MNNNGWFPIKHNPPPEGEEIQVSDGKYIAQVEWNGGAYNGPSYISGYEWECYLDTPLYWKPLGELPVVNAEDIPEPVEPVPFVDPKEGEPGYYAWIFGKSLYEKSLTRPSWAALVDPDKFPENMGYTISELIKSRDNMEEVK